MIWLLIPLGWLLATITVAIGINGFLKAERSYFDMLDRASERARQRVEREMRPEAEIEAERQHYAAMARAQQNAPYGSYGLAMAQQQALAGLSAGNMLSQQGGSNFGLLGPSLNSLFR